MQEKRKPEVKNRYTDIEFAKIYKALKVQESQEIKKRLRDAARQYRLSVDIERELPTRMDERSALKELHKRAVAIAAHATSIESLSIRRKLIFGRARVRAFGATIMKRLTDLKLRDLVNDFEELAAIAKKEARAMPGRGRMRSIARDLFVHDLEGIFRDATGSPGVSSLFPARLTPFPIPLPIPMPIPSPVL